VVPVVIIVVVAPAVVAVVVAAPLAMIAVIAADGGRQLLAEPRKAPLLLVGVAAAPVAVWSFEEIEQFVQHRGQPPSGQEKALARKNVGQGLTDGIGSRCRAGALARIDDPCAHPGMGAWLLPLVRLRSYEIAIRR